MNFIKKIVDGKVDQSVHLQFMKFSKGEFRDRALIEAKKSGEKYTIKTSAEFANELVRDMAEKLGEKNTVVKGVIVSTLDLKGEIEFKEVKQFRGVKRYIIEKEMTGNEILRLMERLSKNFFGLSFSVDDNNVLKVKPKAPKSGKPGKGDEEPKADFCTLKTNDSNIGKGFIFEKEDFRAAKVNHTFFVEEIEIPEELKKEKDFAKMREGGIRKGRIIRKAVIDGEEVKKEIRFGA